MRNVLKAGVLATAALVIGAAGSAHATILTGNYGLSSTGTAGVISVAPDLAQPFSLSLTVGTPLTTDFITLTPDPGPGTNTYNFTITANFLFTLPGTGSDSDLGIGTFHVQGTSIDTGNLLWGPSVNIPLSDGSILNFDLSDITLFSGPATGGNPEIVEATFTLENDPTAVPEPASLILLGTGLFGLGLMRWRKAA